MTDAFSLVDSRRAELVEELQAYLHIPSISTLSEHKEDVRRAAEFTAGALRKAGMSTVTLYETPGHPIVYGEWLNAPGKPTVLIYGHYDVQPVDDPHNEWVVPPFSAVVQNDRIIARGSSDDKGQVFANIKAVEFLMQANGGTLPVNVKFLIEGEEESGSVNLDQFIAAHQSLLQADVAAISDSAVLSLDMPAVVYSLRGLAYMEIHAQGPDHDLHSGQHGGAVHNPLQALAEIVAALHNPDGSVAVEGFYDTVRPLSPEERKAIAEVPFTEGGWLQETGVPAPWGESAYTVKERTGARPTLEVHGFMGGFQGEGAKTVIPAKAAVKISCRLVADQKSKEIYELVKRHVAKITPPTVRTEVKLLNHGEGAIVPIDAPAMKAAARAYERGFGKAPVYMREGGSIPVVATFQTTFNIPVLMVGYGLPNDNLHAPNEKFELECYYRGVKTMIALLEELGA
jgi:acetylornithine deacetylase/succinyl-diaminopimelate desuccinylase-like protein